MQWGSRISRVFTEKFETPIALTFPGQIVSIGVVLWLYACVCTSVEKLLHLLPRVDDGRMLVGSEYATYNNHHIRELTTVDLSRYPYHLSMLAASA